MKGLSLPIQVLDQLRAFNTWDTANIIDGLLGIKVRDQAAKITFRFNNFRFERAHPTVKAVYSPEGPPPIMVTS
ncbi:hypothetical protein NBRC111894_313 [Sporolactobacillus inulinus]|uniref:Uncharacterized protein n=2 Tax=Sporolactobacillus inulinus TaxID=2078 RepID=A0A4Y1Z6Z0_9BACL|nr:hypothetical protein NBRC111894_313 [Sporolactobacillus inulinus]